MKLALILLFLVLLASGVNAETSSTTVATFHPSTLALLFAGLLGLGVSRYRQNKQH